MVYLRLQLLLHHVDAAVEEHGGDIIVDAEEEEALFVLVEMQGLKIGQLMVPISKERSLLIIIMENLILTIYRVLFIKRRLIKM